MRRYVICLLIAASLCLSGCGYHLYRPEGPSFAGKTISIPIFVNKSHRAALEAILAANLADEFAMRNGGRVVPEDEAELVLAGTIVSYSISPVSYTAADKIKEYRATITIEATLRDNVNRKVLWQGGHTDGQDFPVNISISLQQNSEDAAVKEICRKLARQMYQKISEDF